MYPSRHYFKRGVYNLVWNFNIFKLEIFEFRQIFGEFKDIPRFGGIGWKPECAKAGPYPRNSTHRKLAIKHQIINFELNDTAVRPIPEVIKAKMKIVNGTVNNAEVGQLPASSDNSAKKQAGHVQVILVDFTGQLLKINYHRRIPDRHSGGSATLQQVHGTKVGIGVLK
ncbi:hypothetical protein FRC07_011121, partial [Ceratobasidium sp. 392]